MSPGMPWSHFVECTSSSYTRNYPQGAIIDPHKHIGQRQTEKERQRQTDRQTDDVGGGRGEEGWEEEGARRAR